MNRSQVVVLSYKIVDYLLLTGLPHLTDPLSDRINLRFSLDTIDNVPGSFHYFGLNIVHFDDYRISVNSDDKLDAFPNMPLSRRRLQQIEEPLSTI